MFVVDGDCILGGVESEGGEGSLLKILDLTYVVSRSSNRGLVELSACWALKLMGVWKYGPSFIWFRLSPSFTTHKTVERVPPYSRRLLFSNPQLSLFIKL